ncbi:MurR/RpiR family transcriptional regulator [Lactobacillus selangorensis]|uniref:MurR/RpiR family transcriptional regulator n=1 Tax=Lactobacillus selangorensis TaxID=81857 RepID=UPI00070EA779|nr:MurR/RpiR family transcriptional regulator [Lactobacillus selangorensis]
MKKLSNSEEYVWRYIQDHVVDIPNLSIVRLSELANVSTATIVRTMKKKGYKGYTDFRHEIIRHNSKNVKYQNLKQADDEIRSVIFKSTSEVENTIKQLNIGVIEDSIQKLRAIPSIYIFARGLSELIAKEMMMKFQLLGKQAEMFTDPNIIRILGNRIPKNSVAIFITLNGQTPELVDAAKKINKREITTITFTTNDEGDILPYSDLVFLGYKSDITYFPEFEVHSRLSLQVMTRILTDAYVVRTSDKKSGS